MSKDIAGAFDALRKMLKDYSDGLIVHADTPTDYTLITPAIAPNKKPLWFAGVQSRKNAVSFHLMPLYFNPALQAKIAPELLARKQGKTCFNFQRPDEALFSKLEALTKQAKSTWKTFGFLDPGQITQDQLNAALRASGEDPEAIARLRKKKGAEAAAKRKKTLAKKRRQLRD